MNGRFVVTRKPYECWFCESTIKAGERSWYERVTPWDHPDNEYYFTLRAHAECEAAWQWAIAGPDPYCYWEDGCHPSDFVAELLPTYRSREAATA